MSSNGETNDPKVRLFGDPTDASRKKVIPAFLGRDGNWYAESDAISDPDDPEYVGGGMRIGAPEKYEFDDGKVMEVREITTASAGGSFGGGTQLPKPRNIPKQRKEQIDRGHQLWRDTPLGKAIVERTTDFIYGRGLSIKATGLASDILKKFWKKNSGHELSRSVVDEATATGMGYLLLRPIKKEVQVGSRIIWQIGQVRASLIDAELVTAVEHDPLDIRDIDYYLVGYEDEEDGKTIKREMKFPPPEKFDPESHEGAIVEVQINRSAKDVFGRGDLYSVDPWIENYEDYLWDSVLINRLYRSPMIDIKIVGGDEAEVRAAIRRYRDFEIGSNPVHNDKEEWNILEFTGANVSQEEARRALLLIVAAGVGMPEFFFGDGSNSNLASAKAMLVPTIKHFQARQLMIKNFWLRVFEFVLRMAEELGSHVLEATDDFDGERVYPVDVTFPPMNFSSDQEITQASGEAMNGRYMSRRTAASRMDLDYDAETAQIEEEEKLDPMPKNDPPPDLPGSNEDTDEPADPPSNISETE